MIKKKVFLVLIFVLVHALIFAQYRLPEVTMPSPTVANLGLFSEVPVTPFTGLADVSIPVYSAENGPIKVPISLSYHGSGVRPDQHPGWTGLNWVLNCGGVITRIAHDLPDEYDCPDVTLKSYPYSLPEFNGTPNYFFSGLRGTKAGYFWKRNYLQGDDWSEAEKIKDHVRTGRDCQDMEPDEFKFNFLQYSGKFFIDENGDWQVQSDQNIKVIFETDHFIDLPDGLLVSKTKHYQAWCSRVSDNLKSFGGFTLITDDGTKYIFGCTPNNISTDAIEYSIPFFQQMFEQWIATSWYLTEIISPDGQNHVTFSYEPDDYVSNMYLYFLWKVDNFLKNDKIAECSLYGLNRKFGNDEWTADWINPRYASYLGNLIRPTYLTEVNAKQLKIKFDRSLSNELKFDKNIYSKNRVIAQDIRFSRMNDAGIIYNACRLGDNSQEQLIDWPFLYDIIQTSDHEKLLDGLRWKKLDKIRILKNNNETDGLQYALTYNNIPSERLMLLSITKSSINNKISKPGYYRFEYYDDSNFKLPGYLEEGTDHWGFANGNTVKSFTLPRSADFVNNGPPRIDLHEPTNDLNVAIENSLKSIYYPTGGSSTFIYEQNRCSKTFDISNDTFINTPEKIAGGLRIKKIVNKTDENDSKPLVTEYLYVTGYNSSVDLNTLVSSGILGGRNQYFWDAYHSKVNDENVKKVNRTIISSQSIAPLSLNSHGTHIGYSEVVKRRSDGAYTIYNFSNFDTNWDEKPEEGSYNDLTPYTVFTDHSNERGQLKESCEYNSNGLPVLKNINTYEVFSKKYARALFLTSDNFICSDGIFTAYLGLPYKVYCTKVLKTKEEKIYYNNEIPSLKQITTYSYGKTDIGTVETFLLESIETFNSNNVSNKTVFRYPSDFSYPYGQPTDPIILEIQRMNDNFLLNYPIESINYRDGRLVDGTIQSYVYPARPFEVYRFESAVPVHGYQYQKTDFGNPGTPRFVPKFTVYYPFKLKFSFDRYDAMGNILQYHSKEGVYTSFVWGYNNTYPTAKIENATYDEVVAVLTPNLVSELNVTELTDEQVRQKLNILLTNSSLKKAKVSIYTYDALKGLTSTTDYNGRTTFYEYDDFDRLKHIRDHENNIIKNYSYSFRNR